jgi:hypothetical protein
VTRREQLGFKKTVLVSHIEYQTLKGNCSEGRQLYVCIEAGSPRAVSPSAPMDSSASVSLLRSSKCQRVSLGGSDSLNLASTGSIVTTISGTPESFNG